MTEHMAFPFIVLRVGNKPDKCVCKFIRRLQQESYGIIVRQKTEAAKSASAIK